MSRLSATLKKEFFELLPPTIFFFIALTLVALVRMLMLNGTGVPTSTLLSVAVSALILGKSVLIADLLPFINRYPSKPLLYNILWKTAIYLVAATIIHYLERLYDFWRETGSFVAGNQKLLDTMVWPQFWGIHIFLCVLIFIYCLLHEVARVLGRDRMRQLFLSAPASSALP